jgi:dTDP-6-deoxy-L-talose 4-dehydrogenase (NAD+)
MRVLVTGATGGLGSSIINRLLKEGTIVIATSRNESKIIHCNFYEKVKYVPYDLSSRSSDNLFIKFGKPDKLIHLAWDKLQDQKNIAHTTTILEDHKSFISNLISNGLKDVNIIGTAYEYGLSEGIQKETDSPRPIVAYGIGKNKLREYIEVLQNKNDFTFKWIRVFNIFGAGKSGGNLYSQLVNAIESNQAVFNMSGGEQTRDYMTAEETAEIIFKISMQNRINGIINCASGKPVKLKEMVSNFLAARNVRMNLNLGYYPYLDYEPMNQWGATEKLNRLLRAEKNQYK